jgi:hypothetical protein
MDVGLVGELAWLQPAAKVGTRRSPVSGDLFVCWAAANIAVRFSSQLDPQLAVLRSQDDRFNQPTEHL